MQVLKSEGVNLVELPGRVDVSSSPALESLLNGLLDTGQVKIICDFSKTEYVSSMGLRVFLSTLKRTRKSGGNLVLCCLKPGILEIFDMTGLTGLLPILDTSQAALTFFRQEIPQAQEVKIEKPFDEIIIDKPPQEATRAYVTTPKQVRMDEKI
jgi:anti-sigma B factor antagonist